MTLGAVTTSEHRTDKYIVVAVVVVLLISLFGYLLSSNRDDYAAIKGVTIEENLLVPVSGTYPKAYWALPKPDYAWEQLRDLGVSVIQVARGIEGDVLRVCLNPGLSEYCKDWAQNLDTFLTKAGRYGLKVVFHSIGNIFGVIAPMHNARDVRPYTTISDALSMIDELGGNNSLHRNFIADGRILWWSPINEGDIDDFDVKAWLVPMLERIRYYGGETSVAVFSSQYLGYFDSLPRVISVIGDLVDYLQAHEYHHEIVKQVVDSSSDMYSAVYSAYSSDFETMVANRGAFSSDKLMLTEFACGSGYWQGLHVSPFAITTTEHQQAEYIRGVFDAARRYGIRKLFWEEPFDLHSAINDFGFIRYNGSIVEEPYNVFKSENVRTGQ